MTDQPMQPDPSLPDSYLEEAQPRDQAMTIVDANAWKHRAETAEAQLAICESAQVIVDDEMIKRARKAAPSFWRDYGSSFYHMRKVLEAALSEKPKKPRQKPLPQENADVPHTR